MARPRLGYSATRRFQMVITEDEFRAIENWRYANKIPSTSEAVRKLCAYGLMASEPIRFFPLKPEAVE
jgi:hypothetical protein